MLVQRLSGRLAELETWLAMLIVRHGETTDHGWRYIVCDEHAAELRAMMPRGQLSVSIGYDRGVFVLDAL